MKKIIPLMLLMMMLLVSCGNSPQSIHCNKCDTENDLTNMYCYNCVAELKLSEEEAEILEKEYGIKRIDNRYDVIISFIESGKFKDAYKTAGDIYKEGDIDTAKRIFQYLGKFKEAKMYLDTVNLLDEYQGVYCHDDDFADYYIVIEGNTMTRYNFGADDVSEGYLVNIDEENGAPCLYMLHDAEAPTFWWYPQKENGQLQIAEGSVGENPEELMIYKKIDNTTKAQVEKLYNSFAPEVDYGEEDKYTPSKPYIGMTAAQVRVSTWGEPIEIKKTTYSWGVQEQWVYGGGRYIYLENGFVTAISE